MAEKTCCQDEHFDKYIQKIKICGYQLRQKILCLIDQQYTCDSDTWRYLEHLQPVIIPHLVVPKDRGVVEFTTEENRRYCGITDEIVHSIMSGSLYD